MAGDMYLNLPGNVKIPALGYGTWQSTDDSLEKALEIALETGYRHIDTAQRYQNEEIVGKVLKRWFDSGRLKREDIFVTTKISPMSLFPDKVEETLKTSLRKLQLDHVDLYLVHFPVTIIVDGDDLYGDTTIDYLDIWKKMEEQHDAGRTKFIGVSNYSVKKIARILENCRIRPANNQIEMHAYFQQRELVEFCKKNGVTIVAYAPVGTRGYNTFLKKVGAETAVLPDLLSDVVVKSIAQKHSKTSAQVLIRFLLQLGVSTIPKSVTPSRIKENFDVFNFSLDEGDMTRLRALDRGEAGRILDFRAFGKKVANHPYFEF